MEKINSEISPPIQEKNEPAKSHIEKLGRLFLCRKIVTVPSKTKDGIERPLSVRASRAELYKKYRSTEKENTIKRKQIIEQAHIRDEILKQYLNQGEVIVSIPHLGEQKARYTTINPSETLKNKEKEDQNHVFLIPGLSNDIDCVGALAQEAAFLGKRITVIAFPESFKGKATQEFANAVEKDKGYGPHVEFFKNAIKQLSKEKDSLELWGLSTGAPIVCSILNDPQFVQKTENAVLFAPASSVSQLAISLNTGIINDFLGLKKFRTFPYWNYTYESKKPREKEQIKLRKEIYKSLLKRTRTRLDYWKTAKVKEKGSIVVVSGRKDKITKSSNINNEVLRNPQVKLLDLQNMYHITPNLEPNEILSLVFKFQKEEKENLWSFDKPPQDKL